MADQEKQAWGSLVAAVLAGHLAKQVAMIWMYRR
jgi:hypothetical protein